MSEIIMGMKKGLMRFGPFSRRTRCWSSNVVIPPIPDPTITPNRVGSTRSFTPRCFTASADAALLCCAESGVLRHVRFQVLDGVRHRGHLLRVLVRNFDVEFLLEGHDELYGVERVGSEIVDERRLRRHLLWRYAQLVDD